MIPQEADGIPVLPDGRGITPPGFWVKYAACDPWSADEWFPDESHHGLAAKRVCNERCPVRLLCLDYAITNNEQHGTWGGMSPGERKKEAERREADQEREKEDGDTTEGQVPAARSWPPAA